MTELTHHDECEVAFRLTDGASGDSLIVMPKHLTHFCPIVHPDFAEAKTGIGLTCGNRFVVTEEPYQVERMLVQAGFQIITAEDAVLENSEGEYKEYGVRFPEDI